MRVQLPRRGCRREYSRGDWYCNALDIAITIPECKTPEQVTGTIGNKVGKVAIILTYERVPVRLLKLSSAYFHQGNYMCFGLRFE
jgi:hypothetical protein